MGHAAPLALSVLPFPVPDTSVDLSDVMELYWHGQYQRAVDLLSSREDSSGNPAMRRLWLGKAYLKLRRWDDAIRELELAAQAEPRNCLLHLWLGRAYGRKAVHVVFFRAMSLAGNLREEFERARSLCPANLEVRFDLLEFYIEAPGMIGGGKPKAEAEAQEISRLDPRRGFHARGRIAERVKDWDLARREFEAGVKAYPKEPIAHCDLAEYLFRRQSYAEAGHAARQALQLKADYPKAQFLVAASEIVARRNLPEAVRTLDALSRSKLLDDDPTFQDVYCWLGKGLIALGKHPEGVQALEAALRLDPEHPDAKAALESVRGRS